MSIRSSSSWPPTASIVAHPRNRDRIEEGPPEYDARRLPVAPDAYGGPIQLYYVAGRVPAADETSQTFRLDRYLMEAHLRRMPDGTMATLYYVAHNEDSAFRPEYVVGPNELGFFRDHIYMYENLAAYSYPLEKGAMPAAYQVHSARFVVGTMEGDVDRASEGIDAWTSAVKDPGWWLQVGMGYASAHTPKTPATGPATGPPVGLTRPSGPPNLVVHPGGGQPAPLTVPAPTATSPAWTQLGSRGGAQPAVAAAPAAQATPSLAPAPRHLSSVPLTEPAPMVTPAPAPAGAAAPGTLTTAAAVGTASGL